VYLYMTGRVGELWHVLGAVNDSCFIYIYVYVMRGLPVDGVSEVSALTLITAGLALEV
jgi:hypothetical protein